MTTPPLPPVVSTRRILTATAIAAALALVVLVTTVLPAEYGIDPLGTGRALGLNALAAAGGEEDAAADGQALEAVRAGAHTPASVPLAQDEFTVELRPYEGVEYKYRVEQGASLVYTWTATSPVEYDFHGEPDGAPARYSESYATGNAAAATGTFFAPTPGVHGWFWENPGTSRITITLKTSGFYTKSTEYRDGERIERTFGGR
jgi:hypothetical protein